MARFAVSKNSRGFWLSVCIAGSVVAGWLMFHFGLLNQ